MQQYLDNCTNLPPDKKTQISVIINQPPSATSGFQLTDGMVIADFYVPYMCCSDCPPIAYILPTPPAPPDDKPIVKAISVCRSVKELPLEPNLPAGAIIKVLTSEGNIMDDKLIIHPSATGINKTTVFHVSYTVNGKETDVTITVVVVNADFTMEITRPAVTTNVPPISITLKPLDAGLTVSTWQIQQNNTTVTTITDGAAFPLSQFVLDIPIIITHHAEIKTDGESCGENKSFTLNMNIIKLHLNKGPFDNNTTQ